MAQYIKTEDGYKGLEESISVVTDNKMDKTNPTGTGSFSMNRKAGTVIGTNSHAEGSETVASGYISHAEGANTTASGLCSHAEGDRTTASGSYSHAEGSLTTAKNSSSHAEGIETTAIGFSSHAEGGSTNAFSSVVTKTNPTTDSIITAWKTKKFSVAKGYYSHVEGRDSLALDDYSHAEGYQTTASGSSSHAEGYYTRAMEKYSHTEGGNTTASGLCSHAEGGNTQASGLYSHAEGYQTTASGKVSHPEGYKTTASGDYSHAEGYYTTASGNNSHAEGNNTKANGTDSHVQGKFNIEDTSNIYADIIGNGTSDTARSNAATVDWNGNAWFAGDVYTGSTSGTNKDDGSKKLATEEYVNKLAECQADWAQNDETAKDYIKNRICYKEEIKEEVYSNSSLNVTNAGYQSDITVASLGTDANIIYKIIWDGTEYTCTCNTHYYYGRDWYWYGNANLGAPYNEFGSATDEPFMITDNGGLYTDQVGSHSLVIKSISTVYHTLDPNYLAEVESALSDNSKRILNTAYGDFILKNNKVFVSSQETVEANEINSKYYHPFNFYGYDHSIYVAITPEGTNYFDNIGSLKLKFKQRDQSTLAIMPKLLSGREVTADDLPNDVAVFGRGFLDNEIYLLNPKKPILDSITGVVTADKLHNPDHPTDLVAYNAFQAAVPLVQGMNLTGAQVGQTIKVKAVNEQGMPTAWEAADMSSGDRWELINAIEIPDGTEETNALTISADKNGNAFSLKKARLITYFPKYTGESSIPGYSFTMINGVTGGPQAPLCYTSGLPSPDKSKNPEGWLEVDLSMPGYEVERVARFAGSGGRPAENMFWGARRLNGAETITSIGGTNMLIYPGCKFILYGVRA